MRFYRIIILLLLAGCNDDSKIKKCSTIPQIWDFMKSVDIPSEKFELFFDKRKKGVPEIALIMMTKDEEDIIYENLCWHYAIGFRKFVLLNNNSSDKTRKKMKEFREKVKNTASVYIIDDPIIDFIQGQKTTAAMKFATGVWKDVKWIFPVDSDEFWCITKPIDEILKNVPKKVDAIVAHKGNYFPDDSYQQDQYFYKTIKYRLPLKSSAAYKIAIRVNDNISIQDGNHAAKLIGNGMHDDILRGIFGKSLNYCSYTPGILLGIHMREYNTRSKQQLIKKYKNAASLKLAIDRGLVSAKVGSHWIEEHNNYLKKGEAFFYEKFKSCFIKDTNKTIYDPLPIEEVLIK